jgi:hypothetical protein
MTEKTTVVKDHKNIDQLLIHASYIASAFETIFAFTHPPEIKTHTNTVSMMLLDMALLYLKYDSDGRVLCIVSLHDNCETILTAELIAMLKDIFHSNMYINEDTYVQDLANKDLIWGREDIDDHLDKVWGKKITHSIMFDDSMAGHS